MATYKYPPFLNNSNDNAFDTVHVPGGSTPFSGIYRCEGCGREIVSEETKPFPSQNHHQHNYAQGAIRWRLTVYADHKPK